jgi:transposase
MMSLLEVQDLAIGTNGVPMTGTARRTLLTAAAGALVAPRRSMAQSEPKQGGTMTIMFYTEPPSMVSLVSTKAALKVFAKIKRKRPKAAKSIKAVYADKGFLGSTLSGWLKGQMSATIHVTANLSMAVKKFVPAKKCWVVERSFAWLSDNRRLSVDRERDMRNSLVQRFQGTTRITQPH